LDIAQGNIKPLCVDLDGTLVSTDTLMESILIAVKRKPLLLMLLPFWLMKGRAYLKKRVSENASIDAALLPYKEQIINYIKSEKDKGREIVLATATDRKIALAVSSYLNLFDKVIATENNHNLRSKEKRNALVELFGEKGFDYIGDSRADLTVWTKADVALIVEPSRSLLNKVKLFTENIIVFEKEKQNFKLFIKEIRVYQWIKNILIFLPFIMAHSFETRNFVNSFLAFLSFSFIASFVYILNDLLDLESDRQHPSKKNRPFASGNLGIHIGLFTAPIFLIAGFCIGYFLLAFSFFETLIVYLLITTAYSFYLKKIIILDVILLSCLYTIRLIAGATATGIEASTWLLGFSIFLFLSLAIMKRYTEIRVMIEQNKSKAEGRGYRVEDIDFLKNVGPATGYMSVLILALYVNSEKVLSLYHNPQWLWLTLLCFVFWVSRIWLKAQRGEMLDDPIVFTAKDKVSYFVGLIILILAMGASL
jgi:4-hydroxybenzoate polyprenyltransferase/phosphoserine phosphatase